MTCRIPLDGLFEEKFAQIICYPKYDAKDLATRIYEMKQSGIEALCFTGDKKIGNVSILGKGHVGIVILAYTRTGRAALKIRRTDADRKTMRHEADMLKLANSVNVGPRLMGFTENLLLMEYVEGLLFPMWMKKIKEESDSSERIRRVLREVLEQCRRLDEIGLDHGELSRASRHIIVDYEDNPWILDFETASTSRKASNVTSICQFLFLKGKTAELINEDISFKKKENFIFLLRRYKRNRTRRDFDEILKACTLIR